MQMNYKNYNFSKQNLKNPIFLGQICFIKIINIFQNFSDVEKYYDIYTKPENLWKPTIF